MPLQPCWNSSKPEKSKRRPAGTPASAKIKKTGLLELQQAQKIKKQLCWNSSKRKNQKNGAAGTPASAKKQKTGLLELQQAQKIKKQPCWNSSKPEKTKNGPARTPASLRAWKALQHFEHNHKKTHELKSSCDFFYDSHAVKPTLQPR